MESGRCACGLWLARLESIARWAQSERRLAKPYTQLSTNPGKPKPWVKTQCVDLGGEKRGGEAGKATSSARVVSELAPQMLAGSPVTLTCDGGGFISETT
jgi:hypothetical protein